MADSLVFAGVIELLGGQVSQLPRCAGAVFWLGKGSDFGQPKVVSDLMAALAIDGEVPIGRRASNRELTLPVTIFAPDRETLAAAREEFLARAAQERWPLVYTRDGGEPLVYDCYQATSAQFVTDLTRDKQLQCAGSVTFPAAPYGRSDTLTVLEFPGPSVGWSEPPDPVRADDYSAVSSTTQASWWRQSRVHLADSYSAWWGYTWSDRRSPCWYTRTLPAAVDITGRDRLTFGFGLGTNNYSTWHQGTVTFAVTLTDASARVLRFGGGVACKASAVTSAPTWTTVTFAIPADASFDYAHVTAYSIKAWRKIDSGGCLIIDSDCYLNGLTATPAVTAPIAQVRGTVYQFGAPPGTARSPITAQFQPPLHLLNPSSQSWTTPGEYWWTPPYGVSSPAGEENAVKVRVRGASGKGGDRTTAGPGGGSGGGAVVADDDYPVIPGVPIKIRVGAGGSAGGYPSLAASYYVHRDSWDSVTLVTPSFTPAAGEVIIVKGTAGENDQVFGTPSGGGLTFTSRVNLGQSGYNRVQLWSAVVGAGGSPMTVSLPISGASRPHQMVVERWQNAKLAATPAVASAYATGSAPSATCTTAANNSVVSWVCGDNQNQNGSGRAYRDTPVEEAYDYIPAAITAYWCYQQAASAGAQTLGLTAPGSQMWELAGIEIQAFNTGALTDGGTSAWDDTAMIAAGGKSVPANTATGGLGGAVSDCTVPDGAVAYRGGNGFTGTTTGGGGGSAAGDDAQGADATGQAGATAPAGGGSGGLGGAAGGNNPGAQGTAPAGGAGGAFSTGGSAAGANGRDGSVTVWYTPPLAPFKVLLVTVPGYDTPPTFNPFVPVGAGLDPPDGREYPVDSPVPGLPARFYGTYSVVAFASGLDSPGVSRDLTVTVTQYDYSGGPSATASVKRTYTPNTENPPIANGVVVVGEITLPPRDIAEDQVSAYLTVKVTSTNSADRILDLAFCDVAGQLLLVNVDSGSGYVNYWADEPLLGRIWGRVLGSVYERGQAVSVLDDVIMSGGPLMIDPEGPGWLGVYSPDAGAPSLTASYYARFRDSRVD